MVPTEGKGYGKLLDLRSLVLGAILIRTRSDEEIAETADS
jgi:hypothetical protein